MPVMREHGTPATSLLYDIIFYATIVSRIQYAAPAWSGLCLAADRARLDSILRRSKRLGYCSKDLSSIADLFNSADDDFFHRINTNPNNVLQPYLYRTRSTYLTSSETALIWLLLIKQNFLTILTSLFARCTNWFTQPVIQLWVILSTMISRPIHYSRQFYICVTQTVVTLLCTSVLF